MEINLGRVVGSRIRVGKTVPLEFPKWLDGDIFIHNSGEIPFYEYKPESSEKLIFLGNLKGEQGPQGGGGEAGNSSYERLKRVSIMPSDVEEELGDTALTYPFWKGILTTLDIREGLSENYDNVFFIEVEDPEQNDKVNYLIIQNEFEYIITNFKSFIDYDKISQTYKVYDLIDLYDKTETIANQYVHHISYGDLIVQLFFSVKNYSSKEFTKVDMDNYFPEDTLVGGVTGYVYSSDVNGNGDYYTYPIIGVRKVTDNTGNVDYFVFYTDYLGISKTIKAESTTHLIDTVIKL